jgi:phosphatidylglycerophosphate synthase
MTALRAALTAPPAGDPDARVAGLTVLERQLVALKDAGFEEVAVALPVSGLPKNPRLGLRVVSSFAPGSPPPDDGPTLVQRIGLVTHRSLPQRLARAEYAGDIERAPLLPGEFIVATSDDAARRRAESLLLQSLIKPTDGLVSRQLNRPVSLRITRGLLDTSLTPNQMTLIALAFGIAAVVLVGCGGKPWLFAGALLLHAQSVLDGCDGEISRLKYIRSRAGEWMDQLFDDFVNLGFFAVAGFALYGGGVHWALGATLIGVTLHVVYQIALYAALLTRGGGSGSVTSIRWWGQKDWAASATGPAPGGPLVAIREALEITTRRDFFCFLWLPAIALGVGEVALAWMALVFASSGFYTGLCWLLAGGPSPAIRTS